MEERSEATWWYGLAAASAAAVVIALVASTHYNPEIRLPFGQRIQATLVIAAIATVATVASLVGSRHRSVGLLGWSSVLVACSAFWLAIGKHSLSGPVVLELGRDHGIHLTDGFALLPLAGAALLAGHALRTWPQERVTRIEPV